MSITAKYTMLYKDWLELNYDDNNTYEDKILLAFNLPGISNSSLYTMLYNKYAYSEISTDTANEMLTFMVNVFNEKYQYYYELFNAYNKEYDYSLNNKKVTTREDHSEYSNSKSAEGNNDSKHTDYALPNKVVPSTYENIPSGIAKDEEDLTSNESSEGERDYTTSVTVNYNNEFLELKKQYINQIRNLYSEFAEEFKDCFYHIY